jgi:uncharacterized protein
MSVQSLAGVDVGNNRGSWITIKSGTRFYPLDPKESEINIEDIAHSLSLICRYNGHCDRFYSVAEHSLYCMQAAGDNTKLALACLLHDASEAFIGDMTRPLKYNIPAFIEIEDSIQYVIWKKFNLNNLDFVKIKEIDNRVCSTEKEFILKNSEPWPNMPPAYDWLIIPEKAPEIEDIKNQFLDSFKKLTQK